MICSEYSTLIEVPSILLLALQYYLEISDHSRFLQITYEFSVVYVCVGRYRMDKSEILITYALALVERYMKQSEE